MKKVVLKAFQNFQENTCEKEIPIKVFSCKFFEKNFKDTFFTEPLWTTASEDINNRSQNHHGLYSTFLNFLSISDWF